MDAIKRSLGLSSSPPTTDTTTTSMVIVENPNPTNGVPVFEEVRTEPTDAQVQVKDRLVSIWNNMKFSKTLWDVKKTTFSRNSPVMLLGHSYPSPSRRSSVSGSCEEAMDDSDPDPLSVDFNSKLWMTYRKDFECFPGTNIDSDCGWGCMIR